MSRSRLVAFVGVFLGLCFASVAGYSQEPMHTKDSLDAVKRNLNDKKAVLVDVREKAEWDEGHLENAILLPLSQLKDGKELKPLLPRSGEKPIVYCHCRAGRRALSACEMLQKQGYDVRPLKQGYDELVKEGLGKAK